MCRRRFDCGERVRERHRRPPSVHGVGGAQRVADGKKSVHQRATVDDVVPEDVLVATHVLHARERGAVIGVSPGSESGNRRQAGVPRPVVAQHLQLVVVRFDEDSDSVRVVVTGEAQRVDAVELLADPEDPEQGHPRVRPQPVVPGVVHRIAVAHLERSDTGKAMRPFTKVKTSTLSVSTVSPAAAMCFISNTTDSTPVVKPAMVARIVSAPWTGSTGMLWYTASSAKNDMILSRSPVAHESQNAWTRASGVSAHRADSIGPAQPTGSNGPSTSSSGGPGGAGARIVSLVVARVSGRRDAPCLSCPVTR